MACQICQEGRLADLHVAMMMMNQRVVPPDSRNSLTAKLASATSEATDSASRYYLVDLLGNWTAPDCWRRAGTRLLPRFWRRAGLSKCLVESMARDKNTPGSPVDSAFMLVPGVDMNRKGSRPPARQGLAARSGCSESRPVGHGDYCNDGPHRSEPYEVKRQKGQTGNPRSTNDPRAACETNVHQDSDEQAFGAVVHPHHEHPEGDQ